MKRKWKKIKIKRRKRKRKRKKVKRRKEKRKRKVEKTNRKTTATVNIHPNLNLNLQKKFQRRARIATTGVALPRHLPSPKTARGNAPWIDVNDRHRATDDADLHREGGNLHHEGVNLLQGGSTPLHEEETTPPRVEVEIHHVTRVAADRLPKTTREDDVKRRDRLLDNKNGKDRYLLNHLRRNEQEVLLLKPNHARLHLPRHHLRNLNLKRKLRKNTVNLAQNQRGPPLPNVSSLHNPERNRGRRPHLESRNERNPQSVVESRKKIHLLVVENKEMNLLQNVAKKCATNRLLTVENNDKIRLNFAKNNATIRLMLVVKSATFHQMFAGNSVKNRLKCVKNEMRRLNVV
jgi:hypothetical protein